MNVGKHEFSEKEKDILFPNPHTHINQPLIAIPAVEHACMGVLQN